MLYEQHGGLNQKELSILGISAESIVDFSVNVNPFGPSPKVFDVIKEYNPTDYPDNRAFLLQTRLADLNKVPTDMILVGNGTAEIIWLIAHSFCRKKKVLIIEPTFGEYKSAASAVSDEVVIDKLEEPDFFLPLDKIAESLHFHRPDVFFLCNPNNPTGKQYTDNEIRVIAEMCYPGLLVLDEAYRGFVTLTPFNSGYDDNVLVLRSMTKDFSLAGLRLGYVLGKEDYINSLKSMQPPWSVNGLAQQAGIAALNDLDYLRKTLSETKRISGEFQKELKLLDYRVIESCTHYCLLDIYPILATDLRQKMLMKGIQVRDCSSFGLPHFIRVGAKLPETNQMLFDVLKKTQE